MDTDKVDSEMNPDELRRINTVSGDEYEVKSSDKVTFYEQCIEVRRVVRDYTKVLIFPIAQVTTLMFEEEKSSE